MTLKKKILIGYGVAFVLMGLVVAWAITNIISLGKATNAILSENYRSILAAENMVDALERQDSAMLLTFLGDTAKGIKQFRENEAVFLEWFARAKDNITIQGEMDLVQSIEADYFAYQKKFSSFTDLREADSAILTPGYYRGNGLSILCQGFAMRVLLCVNSTRRRCTPQASGPAGWRDARSGQRRS